MRVHSISGWLLVAAGALCGPFVAGATARDIVVQISVKVILDGGGNPPPGDWTQAPAWDEVMDIANAGSERLRGFRFQYQLDGEVSGASEFFTLGPGEGCTLEVTARANPGQFLWRNDAMNVYIIGGEVNGDGDPICRGFAHSPYGDCGNGVPPGIVVMCSEAQKGMGMVHEFGHFFSLSHTWNADDGIDDTPVDASPNQCTPNDPDTPEPEHCDVVAGFNNECCCDTKTALTLEKAQQEGWSAETLYLMLNNLISYHCDRTDDFTLTNGQLDRWADVAREFRAPLCSGVTYFVDKHAANSSPYDGYSDDPYHTVSAGISAAAGHGGDVVVIRTGSYKEPTTITKRLTLRASRGVVVIGQ